MNSAKVRANETNWRSSSNRPNIPNTGTTDDAPPKCSLLEYGTERKKKKKRTADTSQHAKLYGECDFSDADSATFTLHSQENSDVLSPNCLDSILHSQPVSPFPEELLLVNVSPHDIPNYGQPTSLQDVSLLPRRLSGSIAPSSYLSSPDVQNVIPLQKVSPVPCVDYHHRSYGRGTAISRNVSPFTVPDIPVARNIPFTTNDCLEYFRSPTPVEELGRPSTPSAAINCLPGSMTNHRTTYFGSTNPVNIPGRPSSAATNIPSGYVANDQTYYFHSPVPADELLGQPSTLGAATTYPTGSVTNDRTDYFCLQTPVDTLRRTSLPSVATNFPSHFVSPSTMLQTHLSLSASQPLQAREIVSDGNVDYIQCNNTSNDLHVLTQANNTALTCSDDYSATPNSNGTEVQGSNYSVDSMQCCENTYEEPYHFQRLQQTTPRSQRHHPTLKKPQCHSKCKCDSCSFSKPVFNGSDTQAIPNVSDKVLRFLRDVHQHRTNDAGRKSSRNLSQGTCKLPLNNLINKKAHIPTVSLYEPPHLNGLSEPVTLNSDSEITIEVSKTKLDPSTYVRESYFVNGIPHELIARNELYCNVSGERLSDSYDSVSDADSMSSLPSPLASPEKKYQRHSFPLTSRAKTAVVNRFSSLSNARKTLFKERAARYDLDDLLKPGMKEKVIDTHCHLDFLFSKENHRGTFEAYISKNEKFFPSCFEGCVANFIEPAFFTKKHNWQSLLREDKVWASFGVHPHFCKQYDDSVEQFLKEALQHHRVVAVGEIGLDYSHKNRHDKETQQAVFQKQLKIAVEYNKPIIIHCRDAQEDCLRILTKIVPRQTRIHRHCFTGDWTEAQEWLDRFPHLYIGFTSLITFNDAHKLREVVRQIPLKRLVFETDSPYFVPTQVVWNMTQQERQARRVCNPGMVIHVAAQIAAIKQIRDFSVFLATVRENTRQLYNI